MKVVLTILLTLTAFAVSLAVGEATLRVLTPFPLTEESNMKPDPELLYTADPSYPEIDANGFRNPEPLRARYEVVAIGDSHTYGSNVESSDSWPARFSAATGSSTYNLGMGGYSIYQYDVLFERALAFAPRRILVAIFLANDLMPDCALLGLPAWSERAARAGLQPPCEIESDTIPQATRRSLRSRIRRTAIASAVSTLILDPVRYVWLPRVGLRRPAGPELVQYEVGGRTFAFALGRLRNQQRGTDLSRPYVRAVYSDGLRLLQGWRDRAREAGISLAVAIIPSKQLVLRSWALEKGHPLPDQLRELTDNEAAAARRLLSDLQQLDVPAVEALPFVVARFEESVRAGDLMYPPGLDGHPYASGYAAYAEAFLSLVGNGGQ